MSKDIEIRSLYYCFIKNYKTVLAIMSSFLIIALLYVLFSKRVYMAEATVFVDPQQAVIAEAVTSELSHSDKLTKAFIESQISVISSSKIISGVVDTIKDLHKEDNHSWFNKLKGNDLVNHVHKNLLITHSDETYIINIQYKDNDPEIASKVVNLFANRFISEQIDSTRLSSKEAQKWLSKKIEDLKVQVKQANKEVQEFRVEHNFFSYRPNSGSNTNHLDTINDQLAMSRSTTALARARYEHSRDLIETRNIDAALAEALDNDVINNVRSNYLERKKRYFKFKGNLGSSHSVVKNLRKEIKEYETLILDEMKRLARTQLSSYEIAQRQEETLEKRLAELLQLEKNSSIYNSELASLEQKAKTYQDILNDFITKYENLDQKESFSLAANRVISKSTPPEHPTHPKTFLILFVGLVLGFGTSVILIIYIDSNDNTIKNSEDVFNGLGFRNIGFIPNVDVPVNITHTKHDVSKPIIFRENTLYLSETELPPPATETFRRIKYKLHTYGSGCKTIGVTSSSSDDGKTTISKSLAKYLALSGFKTLLVDFDMANPMFSANDFDGDVMTLRKCFDQRSRISIHDFLQDKETGLSVVLSNIKDEDAQYRPFSFKDFEHVFILFKENFQYIICDLPPLSVTADTEIIMPLIDSFVPIISWGETKVEALQNSFQNVGIPNDKIMGSIINKAHMDYLSRYYFIDEKYFYNMKS